MKELLQQLLNTSTETEVLEFKAARNQYDTNKLGRYFSALSNEANLLGKKCAWLLMGVNNAQSVVGTSISDNQTNAYKREIANHTSLGMGFTQVHRLDYEGEQVLMFEIPAAPAGIPVDWKGHYYAREGESLVALSSDKTDRIKNQHKQTDWSAQIVEDATIDDLSQTAIKRAKELYAVKNPKLKENIASWSDSVFLNKAKITIKGQITRAAIILLGKNESEHFLSPAVARMSWILKDHDNIAKDYEHFSCPFVLSVAQIVNKIRNLKYRYIRQMSLFPDEVDSYAPYVIHEALNNCIAHQDYTLGGKIILVEREDSQLIFLNKGSFIPKTIENVLKSDAPESIYRNKFLALAMVNLGMIDTIGSGIVKMFTTQRDRFFPLPEYSFEDNSVKVTIEGKILDINYATKLASMPDLSLFDIILLDKVQKGKGLTVSEAKQLKKKKLIEGRRPNLHISFNVAKHTNQKEDYIKLKGIDDDYAKKIIIDYLNKFKQAKKSDFINTLLSKMPDYLNDEQKKNKIKNYLQELRKAGKIFNKNKYWHLDK